MESIHKLEKTVAGWYKGAPHLPVGVQKWLADNMWWLALVGAILSVLAVFPLIAGILLAGAIAGGVGATYGAAYGAAGAALTGALLVAALVSVLFLIAEAILLGLAVSPLKVHKKKGWDFLFLLALINVVSVIAGGLISTNVMSIIWGLLWSAVGAYFLFEIRAYFEGVKAHKTPEKLHAKKAE